MWIRSRANSVRGSAVILSLQSDCISERPVGSHLGAMNNINGGGGRRGGLGAVDFYRRVPRDLTEVSFCEAKSIRVLEKFQYCLLRGSYVSLGRRECVVFTLLTTTFHPLFPLSRPLHWVPSCRCVPWVS